MKDKVEDNYTTKQLRDRYNKALKKYYYISKVYRNRQNAGADMTSPKNRWIRKNFKKANEDVIYLADLMEKETGKYKTVNNSMYARSFQHEVNYPKIVDRIKRETRDAVNLIPNHGILDSNVHHTKKTTTMYQFRQIVWLCFTIVVILITLKQLAMPSGGMFMMQMPRTSPLKIFFILGLVVFILISTLDVVLTFYENAIKRTNDMIY